MTVVSHGKRKASLTGHTDEVCIRYSCDHCYRDISHVPRVQCAECGVTPKGQEEEEVDLCVECFAKGVSLGRHLPTHAYRLLPPLNFPLFRPDWRADEEVALLEAVEAHGMGNWREVAEGVGSKSEAECREHYEGLYLRWPGRPLPNPGWLLPVGTELQAAPGAAAKRKEARRDSVSPTEQRHELPSQPACHEVAGFMPGRSEFETEWENDFEAMIRDLSFTDDPHSPHSAADYQLRLCMLDIYSGILDRRQARRDFVLRHRLIDFKRHQATDRMRTREERDFFNLLKPFARFIGREDLQKLLEGLVQEEELRKRIAQLQEYRRMGLRSFSQVSGYEQERKHLELYLKGGMVQRQSASREPFPLPSLSTPHHPLATARSPKAASMLHGQAASSSHLSLPTAPLATASAAAGVVSSSASQALRKASAPLNISHAEGVEMLSERERHICSILRLYPRLYLTIKDTLIRECLRLGGLKRAQARAAVKIDVNKTSKLYDFFMAAGWIQPPASGE